MAEGAGHGGASTLPIFAATPAGLALAVLRILLAEKPFQVTSVK